jgi:putative peptidoglycan binding protein
MMAKLAKTLRILRDDNINIKWPKRPRNNDGWIGDEWHQQRNSDHNPNKRDTVDAIDADSTQPPAPATPIHVPTVIASMIMHPSTHYVIHNSRIMDADDRFMPHVYTGTNPHKKHIHDSVRQSGLAENSTVVYKFIKKPMNWLLLKRNSKGNQVKELQAYLIGWGYAVSVDGDFGAKTEAAVRAFQKRMKIQVDGQVGPATRWKLRPFA